jgi:hypothetical protein
MYTGSRVNFPGPRSGSMGVPSCGWEVASLVALLGTSDNGSVDAPCSGPFDKALQAAKIVVIKVRAIMGLEKRDIVPSLCSASYSRRIAGKESSLLFHSPLKGILWQLTGKILSGCPWSSLVGLGREIVQFLYHDIVKVVYLKTTLP